MSLGNALDGARIVKQDTERGYVLAWFGGHGMFAFNLEGDEISHWNIGDTSANDADIQDVYEDMYEEIETGDYLER